MERSEQLAKQHWGYVEALLKAHLVDDGVIAVVGYHYQTAFSHGYKHGQEDLQK